MNRNRMLVGLAVAVVVGLLLSTYVYRAFKNATAVKPIISQHIVVAAVPLQLGTRVDANNLRLIPWPSNEPVSGMFTRIEDCANRALITPVAENEPILESKLASVQSGAGLPATIPDARTFGGGERSGGRGRICDSRDNGGRPGDGKNRRKQPWRR
jgi:pilus assembly protein CpaB